MAVKFDDVIERFSKIDWGALREEVKLCQYTRDMSTGYMAGVRDISDGSVKAYRQPIRNLEQNLNGHISSHIPPAS